MVGRRNPAQAEGDPVGHGVDAAGARDGVRPVFAHPGELAEGQSWVEGQARQFEDAVDADLLADGLGRGFRAAVMPDDRRRQRAALLVEEHAALAEAGDGEAGDRPAGEGARGLGETGEDGREQ